LNKAAKNGVVFGVHLKCRGAEQGVRRGMQRATRECCAGCLHATTKPSLLPAASRRESRCSHFIALDVGDEHEIYYVKSRKMRQLSTFLLQYIIEQLMEFLH